MWILFLFCVQFLLLSGQVVNVILNEPQDEVGEALFLTPLLEQDKVSEAQQLSRVKPDIGNMTSYSGYLTVNKNCESNLFFWFFPAQKNWEHAPLVLFVQGGPGASSLYCLFEELGPFTYIEELGKRQYSWNVENNLLFIDQPVGTGFSFTGKGCYAQNDTVAGEELYSAILQFYQLFPQFINNKFFITGHSYGGHFVPALGHIIHKNNPSAEIKINLSGMMIGNGWFDISYQNDFGSYLYQLGLIDDAVKNVFYEKQEELLRLLEKKEWTDAVGALEVVLGELYSKYVGHPSVYNYLTNNYSRSYFTPQPYEQFLQSADTRKAIHVGNVNFTFLDLTVRTHLAEAVVKSVKSWVEELLEHYSIVFYYGQLDIICGYPLGVKFLRSLEWSGREEYHNATRLHWCEGNQQPGYFKSGHNLYEVLVRGAGHSVPYDQPHWGYLLVNSVTSSSDNPLHALNTCK